MCTCSTMYILMYRKYNELCSVLSVQCTAQCAKSTMHCLVYIQHNDKNQCTLSTIECIFYMQ